MTQIDEFRVRVGIANYKLKKQVANFLIKLASKIAQEEVEKAVIGLKTQVNIRKYVPQDNEWHHFAMSLDCWVRRNKTVTKKKVKRNIFIDGKFIPEKSKKPKITPFEKGILFGKDIKLVNREEKKYSCNTCGTTHEGECIDCRLKYGR